jgi:hypothetical protein
MAWCVYGDQACKLGLLVFLPSSSLLVIDVVTGRYKEPNTQF